MWDERYRAIDPDLLNRAGRHFGIDRQFRAIGSGHIHDTYVSEDEAFVLQRINTEVFRDPAALMDNISRVTDHLWQKCLCTGRDESRCALRFHPSESGTLFAQESGQIFRLSDYIRDCTVIEPGDCVPEDLPECGRGFGRFLKDLEDMDASCLKETIPGFHDTPNRLENLWDAAKKDYLGRAEAAAAELDFVRQYAEKVSVITDGLAEGSIPLSVTHNDTKINNILFDAKTRKALCVIDLDTVMPGSRLYDYGDALRTAAATAAEDETDLAAVDVNMGAFAAFTKGFLEEVGGVLTEREYDLLPFSFLLMTLECGIRFLEDHLRGDVYFKIQRPFQNLERARNQFYLVRQIGERQQEMEALIRKLRP